MTTMPSMDSTTWSCYLWTGSCDKSPMGDERKCFIQVCCVCVWLLLCCFVRFWTLLRISIIWIELTSVLLRFSQHLDVETEVYSLSCKIIPSLFELLSHSRLKKLRYSIGLNLGALLDCKFSQIQPATAGKPLEKLKNCMTGTSMGRNLANLRTWEPYQTNEWWMVRDLYT